MKETVHSTKPTTLILLNNVLLNLYLCYTSHMEGWARLAWAVLAQAIKDYQVPSYRDEVNRFINGEAIRVYLDIIGMEKPDYLEALKEGRINYRITR